MASLASASSPSSSSSSSSSTSSSVGLKNRASSQGPSPSSSGSLWSRTFSILAATSFAYGDGVTLRRGPRVVPLGGVLGNVLGTPELVVFGNLVMEVLLMSLPISDWVPVNRVLCPEGPACELAFPTLDPDNPVLCPEGPA